MNQMAKTGIISLYGPGLFMFFRLQCLTHQLILLDDLVDQDGGGIQVLRTRLFFQAGA